MWYDTFITILALKNRWHLDPVTQYKSCVFSFQKLGSVGSKLMIIHSFFTKKVQYIAEHHISLCYQFFSCAIFKPCLSCYFCIHLQKSTPTFNFFFTTSYLFLKSLKVQFSCSLKSGAIHLQQFTLSHDLYSIPNQNPNWLRMVLEHVWFSGAVQDYGLFCEGSI